MSDLNESCLPCPFCGSDDISDGEVFTASREENFTQSECQECGALGPVTDLGANGVDFGDIRARAAWNRRAPAASPAPVAAIKTWEQRFDAGEKTSIASAKDAEIADLRAAVAAAPRPTDDDLWDQTLRERDTYHEWADKLADAIAAHFGADIGEHSNQNCPWAEALEVIEGATPQAQAAQQPVADYVLMPRRLTAENGAKGALSGEFKESTTVTCHECGGSGEDDEGVDDANCPECNGNGTVEQDVPVTWDTIKRIYKAAVSLLATPAAPVAPSEQAKGGAQ